MTRTCTLRVSPGAKSGMSLRRLDWSTRSVGFMARRSRETGLFARGGGQERLSLLELGQQSGVFWGQPAARPHEIGPPGDGPPQGLGPAPPVDPAVVTAAEDLRDPPPPELGRPS